jgi:hypothetical protein
MILAKKTMTSISLPAPDGASPTARVPRNDCDDDIEYDSGDESELVHVGFRPRWIVGMGGLGNRSYVVYGESSS